MIEHFFTASMGYQGMPTVGVASPTSLLTIKVCGCNEIYHLVGFHSIIHHCTYLS